MSTIRSVAQVAVFVGLLLESASLGGPTLHSQTVRPPSASPGVRKEAMPTEVRYPQVYVTPDGETHFREVSVPLTSETAVPPVQPFAQSELQAATTIRHAVFPPGWGVYERDHGAFHNPTSARFITVRRGVGWIKTSDGETRRFQAGDVVQVLDVAPSKGHIFWVGEDPMILLSNHR
jgi:hypothetical protein